MVPEPLMCSIEEQGFGRISLGLNHFVGCKLPELGLGDSEPLDKHSIGTLLLNSGMIDVQHVLCTNDKKHRSAP